MILTLILNILLSINCIKVAEEKAVNRYIESNNQGYIVINKIPCNQENVSRSLVFLSTYKYILIAENSSDRSPSISISGDRKQNLVYFDLPVNNKIDISVNDCECGLLIIYAKRK
jgi:hypothetical protein